MYSKYLEWLKRRLNTQKLPKWVQWLAAIMAFIILVALSFATTPSTKMPGNDLPGSDLLSSAGLIFSIIVKLILVLLLIYVTLLVLKRWQGNKSTGARKLITVLETNFLSPRQSIHLVKIGTQVLLIGATDQGISFLSEVQTDDLQQEQTEITSAKETNGANPDFATMLSQTLFKR